MIFSSELIFKYFPNLNSTQKNQIEESFEVYKFWNNQINVISRKDFNENFYVRHFLHSLAIAKYIQFLPKAKIIDVGTGGGFPGVPLAILFPETQFLLVDSIGKKIKVVNEACKALKIENVIAKHKRVEEVKQTFDFVISRAVTQMPKFVDWTINRIHQNHQHNLPNGIIYLKGGDLTEELKGIKREFDITPISTFFEEDFFEEKKIVHLYR